MENKDMIEEQKSEDEIYGEIEAEKLLKKKKTRKIITLCGMSAAFVIALTFIILAVVPVSLKPNCLQGGFNEIYISVADGSHKRALDEKQFMKYYNKAFSQTCLSAIFSGSFKIEESESSNTGITGSQGILNNSPYIEVHCDERKVTNQDGKPLKSVTRGTKWDGVMTFDTAYIVLNTTGGVQETTIYILAKRPEDIFTNPDTNKQLITITIKADTSIIYNAREKMMLKNNA